MKNQSRKKTDSSNVVMLTNEETSAVPTELTDFSSAAELITADLSRILSKVFFQEDVVLPYRVIESRLKAIASSTDLPLVAKRDILKHLSLTPELVETSHIETGPPDAIPSLRLISYISGDGEMASLDKVLFDEAAKYPLLRFAFATNVCRSLYYNIVTATLSSESLVEALMEVDLDSSEGFMDLMNKLAPTDSQGSVMKLLYNISGVNLAIQHALGSYDNVRDVDEVKKFELRRNSEGDFYPVTDQLHITAPEQMADLSERDLDLLAPFEIKLAAIYGDENYCYSTAQALSKFNMVNGIKPTCNLIYDVCRRLSIPKLQALQNLPFLAVKVFKNEAFGKAIKSYVINTHVSLSNATKVTEGFSKILGIMSNNKGQTDFFQGRSKQANNYSANTAKKINLATLGSRDNKTQKKRRFGNRL